MNKKDIKLVLLDLDGTLLDEESELPKKFEEVIDKLNDIGVHVGIATGRNYGTLKLLFGGLEKKLNLITCNGAGLYINGKLINSIYISENEIKDILDIYYDKNIEGSNIVVMRDDVFFVLPDNSQKEYYTQKHFALRETDDLYKNLDNVTAIAVDFPRFERAPIEYFEEFKGNCTFSDGGFGCVNIQSSFTSKGDGAKRMCNYLNIDINNVMAIGDAGNDFEIMSVVGYPVAMKNALDEIKSICKEVTPKTNIENGCLEYLISFFNLK